MLVFHLLLLLATSELAVAKLSSKFRGPHTRVRHGIFPEGATEQNTEQYTRAARRALLSERQTASTSSAGACGAGGSLDIKAPKTNIFQGLDDQEAVGVTAYLHDQATLNLTASATATPWDNRILQVELLQPNKSDALSYLYENGKAPARYARAVIRFGATLKPYIQEYRVGPLPVTGSGTQSATSSNDDGAKNATSAPYTNSTSNATTSSTTLGLKGLPKNIIPLDYYYNKGRAFQRIYDLDQDKLAAFTASIGASIKDITQTLLNGTVTGSEDDTLAIASNTPVDVEGGRVYQWNQFYTLHTGNCFDEDILPTGLMFKADITGRDPSKWKVVRVQYNGILYDSIKSFRKATGAANFVKPGPNVDGAWACTDYNGDPFPHDDLSPPVPVQPDGPRFGVDEEEKYVEWMDFSFYISSSRDFGIQLHNIKYKGERIIYEVGLQEAVAHYASASDPFQGTNAYLDSEYGFGEFAFQLVSGFDCPAYAKYINTSYYADETTHTHPSSICLFEFDTGYPIQRHTTPAYVSVTKNIVFIVRQVATVGNYDYMFDYEFLTDGSIHVTVRASGYIQSSFWATNAGGEDGFHIHDNLLGSMHDHVINYKLDLDVLGTANSLLKNSVVPVSKVYPWSDGKPRNTMTFKRESIDSEAEGKLNWDVNNDVVYTVVNKDQKNKYGEYRGYKLMPATANRNYLTAVDSSILGKSANWATNHVYAVQHKDNEQHSVSAYNAFDPKNPVVDFDKFFNGESLDQEDLVLYFNLGMHHVPDTSDLPNTVFSTAHSSMIITPQNYNLGDPSRSTIHQTRINAVNGTVTDALTFGAKQPTCSLDLSITAPDLKHFVGEAYVEKYPRFSDSQMIGNPGDGLAPIPY